MCSRNIFELWFNEFFFTEPIVYIRLETKSCRVLPLTYGTKYDMT